MFRKTLISLAVASSLGLTGCLDSGDTGANANPDYPISNPDYEGKTWPQFNPVPGELPIPNDLIFQSDDLDTVGINEADGTFDVTDTSPPVTTALNKLSGASTVAPIDIMMSGIIDEESVDGLPFLIDESTGELITNPDTGLPIPNPKQNVFLLELDYASGSPLQALSIGEPPTVTLAQPFAAANAGDTSATTIAAAKELARKAVEQYKVSVVRQSTDDGIKSVIRINLLKPLNPNKRYLAVVTKEITAGGEAITASPMYTNLTQSDEIPVGTDDLLAVRTIINKLWEPVAEAYFALPNTVRESQSVPGLSAEDIAFSMSFTTSNDEEILPYMAQPDKWFTDQLRSAYRLAAVRKVVGAASVLSQVAQGVSLEAALASMRNSDEEAGPYDTNGNGEIDALDFDFNGDGQLTTDDFNLVSTGDTPTSPFNYFDIQAAIAAAEAAYPGTLAQADPSRFGPGAPCSGDFETGTAACGSVLAGNFSSLLPDFSDKSDSVDLPELGEVLPAALLTPAVSSIPGSSTAMVLQGSISLPYYLGAPNGSDGSIINSSFWSADHTLAEALNEAFAPLGLQLAQGVEASEGGYVSDAVNALFPFPEKTVDQKVPLLVMLPRPGIETDNGFIWDGTSKLPVVIFQHGITTDRSAALSVGSVLTSAGFGVVAIDLPLHGVDAQDQSDKTSGKTQERQALATKLLEGFDEADTSGVLPDQNTADNLNALLDGTYINQTVALVTGTYGCTETNPVTITSGAGGCSPEANAIAAKLVGFAIGAQNAVENYTSVIPGLPRTDFERHFDFTANASGTPVPMDFDTGIGSSGSLYINLQNFFNTRDKNLQAQADLLNLISSVGNIEIDLGGIPVKPFEGSSIFMAGHSLGTVAVSGAAAVANQADDIPDVTASVLYGPASGITRMLENSPSFAGRILAGLSAKGVLQGSQNYETFMRVIQNAIDPADPINLADDLASSGQGILAFNVVGTEDGNGNTLYPSDQTTVIEAGVTQLGEAFPDYLAGALPLARELGATNVTSFTAGETILASNLAYGTHGMFVLPSENSDIEDETEREADLQRQKDAFNEALLETVEFFLNNGTLTEPAPSTTGRIGAPDIEPVLDSRPIPSVKDLIDNDDSNDLKQLN